MNIKDYAKYIDHTLLKPEAQERDIYNLILEAEKYNFKTICINPSWVSYAKKTISNINVGITTVVGFPLGANSTLIKIEETKRAIKDGASEIDMVINIGRLKQKDYIYVLDEIKKIKKQCKNKILKVIVETALLSKDEIIKITEIIVESGADFIKTSTGFSSRGASFEDILIMKENAKNKIQIKAAGGVKTFEDLIKMIDLGATRIGTSSGVKIFENSEIKKNDY